uniref:protein-disulfide reductase n=1 Tax=Heterorhabditis bacteriophora TaxID=37862 RepID=A0A1I7XRL8_HETBA
MAELLSGITIQLKDGTQVDAGKHLTGKMVGLYFSASWCKPCCIFTPKLKKFYEKIKQGHPEFEIVLVSRDRDEAALFEYYDKHMGSWTFIPFGHHKIQELLTLYKVVTIPSMRVIKPDGTVVVQDARSEIQDKGIENPEDLFEEWEAFYM